MDLRPTELSWMRQRVVMSIGGEQVVYTAPPGYFYGTNGQLVDMIALGDRVALARVHGDELPERVIAEEKTRQRVLALTAVMWAERQPLPSHTETPMIENTDVAIAA